MTDIEESVSSLKDRAKRKLERDLGPLIMDALADPRTVEMMLNAGNLAFLAYAQALGDARGHAIAFFIMAIAAAEAAGVTMYFTGERHFFH